MRILAATHGDGSNRTFQKLMGTLVRGGHSVRVVAWDRLLAHERQASYGGLEHQYIMRGGGLRNARLVLWYPVWMLRLTLHLLRQRPDLVWASNFETALPAALSGLFTRVPFIYYIHDNVCLTYDMPILDELVLRPLDRFAVGRAALVVVPDASRIERHMIRAGGKVKVFPNSPSIDAGDAVQESVSPDVHVYVNGSLWKSRGILELLEAARQVPQCRILVAGNAPEGEVVDRLRAHPQVEYVGPVDHAVSLRLYRRCRGVFAFYDPAVPINIRASPTKLYEAMLMARPVILNSEVLISRRVLDWGVGYSCPYNDTDALAGILRDLVANGDAATQMGASAREIFERELSWEQVGKGLLEAVAAAYGKGLIGPEKDASEAEGRRR